jgi:hypothetical protein
VAVFEFENEFFYLVGIAEGDDDSFYVSVFVGFAVKAGFIFG